MLNKMMFFIVATVIVLGMVIFFILNPSYEKSLEAKYYFETADYNQAYKKANEAFKLDIYNRMASTIMAQSKISLKYVKYINRAKKYLKEIKSIASDDGITDAQRAKIRMMSEIMVESYIKLTSSVITDEELVKQAEKYHKEFKQLLREVKK